MNKQRIILFLLLSAALWGLPRRASAQIFAVRANALAACSATLNVGAETALGVMVAASVWSLLIPEMSQGQHSNVGTVFFAVGFSVMMVLDVALG